MGRKSDDAERAHALRQAAIEHWGAGGGFGGRGRRRRGDVRQAILSLLSEQPSNGYGLMQTIEQRSSGRWRPSPGSVYPTLAQLEDEGLVTVAEREGIKLYTLTDAGRQAAEGASASPWECAEAPGDGPDLYPLLKELALAVKQVGRAGTVPERKHAAEILAEARRNLYRILAEADR